MYNRYIPQSDGSYRKSQVPDRTMQHPTQEPIPAPPVHQPKGNETPPSRPTGQNGVGIAGFLRQLLPGDFDTNDLLIVLLLLIMAGDSREDQNYALLTLALYLFM